MSEVYLMGRTHQMETTYLPTLQPNGLGRGAAVSQEQAPESRIQWEGSPRLLDAPVFFQRASGTAATLDTEHWTLIWQTQAGYASGQESGNVGAGGWAINN